GRAATGPAPQRGGARGPLDAGDPGAGADPSGGRPRPTRPRRLGGRRRPAGRRPRARVARGADRAHLPVPARAGGPWAWRRYRGPLRDRPPRPAVGAGAGGRVRPEPIRAGAKFRARLEPLPRRTDRTHPRRAVRAVLCRSGRVAPAAGRALGAAGSLRPGPRVHAPTTSRTPAAPRAVWAAG